MTMPTTDKTLLILGGYGHAGLAMARLLLQETGVRLILAGRSGARAEQAAAELNREFPGSRVSARQLAASQIGDHPAALAGAQMLVLAAPAAPHVQAVATAALAAGVDYLDILYPQSKVPVLQALAPAIAAAGRCFLTEAGFHPGLPAALIRYGAPRLQRPQRATVGMAMNTPIPMTESAYELGEDLSRYRSYVFHHGRWRPATYRDMRRIDFGGAFGVRSCWPMWLEELRPLPEQFALGEVGMYAAGFNWFVDYLVAPLLMGLGRIRQGLAVRPLTRLLVWGLNAFSRPPFGVVLKLEVTGEQDGRPRMLTLTVRHADGYILTAAPAVAGLLQYLDGTIHRPGLWMLGHTVDPQRLLSDMGRMGIECAEEILPG